MHNSKVVRWVRSVYYTRRYASSKQQGHIILRAIIICLITLMGFVLFWPNIMSGCIFRLKNKTKGSGVYFSFARVACHYCMCFSTLCTVTSVSLSLSLSSNVDLVDSRALGQPWVWWGQIEKERCVICSYLYMYALCAYLTYNHYHGAHIYLYCK